MKKLIVLLLLTLSFETLLAQSKYAQHIVDTLCSTSFMGRGYTNDGMKKAAYFIESEMKQIGLQPVNGNKYLQTLSIPVNTFPGKMEVKLGNKKLEPGKDFLVYPGSKSIDGKYKMNEIAKDTFLSEDSKLLITKSKKLTWSALGLESEITVLELNDSINDAVNKITLDIDNKFIPNFEVHNVCGMVKGTQYPDSFLVLTAHYDHLGEMGAGTYFPGANDNASGTALLLELAKYFSKKPQSYSIVFIAFAAEEIGLKGSEFFVKHPYMPLSRIKFLLNLDLMGNGEDGITVVNATEYPQAFDLITNLNKEHNWFKVVNARGKAANSDHYHFSEQGVPAFFIYTLGGNKAYHDIYDVPQTLPLKHFDDLKEMIRLFFEGF